MKRCSPAPFAILAALAAFVVDATPVRAEDRQVIFNSASLQNYLNGVSEDINVTTHQVPSAQRWRSTISGNSAMTLMIEMAVNADGNSIGVYNAGDANPTLFEIFPGTAVAKQFAVASFRSATQKLIVTLFEDDGTIINDVTYNGVTTDNFGYYISNAVGGTGYSEDTRNDGALARMLAYRGTDENTGNWWLCFEDNVSDPSALAPGDRDFDDAVVFVESINPTAVSRTTWGALKSRFR